MQRMSRRGGKRTAQGDIIIVVQLIDSINLATNVELLSSLVQVLDGRVLRVTTEDQFTLLDPKIRERIDVSQTCPRRYGSCPLNCCRGVGYGVDGVDAIGVQTQLKKELRIDEEKQG